MSDKKRSIYRKEYFAKRKMRIAVVVALLAVLAVLEIYSLSVNNFKVTFVEAWDAVINRIRGIPPVGYIENMIDYVVIEVDAPRAIGAIMVGTILAVCGAVMQTITRNALAEPYTMDKSDPYAYFDGVGLKVLGNVNGDNVIDNDDYNAVKQLIDGCRGFRSVFPPS